MISKKNLRGVVVVFMGRPVLLDKVGIPGTHSGALPRPYGETPIAPSRPTNNKMARRSSDLTDATTRVPRAPPKACRRPLVALLSPVRFWFTSDAILGLVDPAYYR